MRILNGLFALALMGASSLAVADEPTRLGDAELDSVSAGAWRVFTLSQTAPAGTIGSSSSISQISRTESLQIIELTPPEFSGSVSAFAQSQSLAAVSGIGQTAAFGGGRVYTGVTPAN